MNKGKTNNPDSESFDSHGEDTSAYTLDDNTLALHHSFVLSDLNVIYHEILEKVENLSDPHLIIDLSDLKEIDSAGVAGLNHLRAQLKILGKEVHFTGGNRSIKEKMDLFTYSPEEEQKKKGKVSFFETIGEQILHFYQAYFLAYLKLAADVIIWSATDVFKSHMHRKGEFYNQAVRIGVNAVFIICLLSFIIGLVIALQSAEQLRNFGANIYIVDLIVISMMREMGPLITAILVAGRSGSAIAAEIATMKVTSELDAIRTMALNPIRFVIVPKMHGSIATMPFLTILADVMGILGGMLIAFLYLGISPEVFINRMGETLYNRDILIGIFKSLVFATLIVLTGSFFGLSVKEGAEGVGKVTTIAVVVSISIVIVADSIIGLIFY